MERHAAFTAVYSDWKLIRSRGVVQVVLEVPVEQSSRAYEVLSGMPVSGKSAWVAVARLSDNAVQQAAAIPADKRLAKKAGQVCADPVFRRFLNEEGMLLNDTEEAAATAVRLCCGVDSRSKIVPGTAAAQAWDDLYGRFVAWREAPELAG